MLKTTASACLAAALLTQPASAVTLSVAGDVFSSEVFTGPAGPITGTLKLDADGLLAAASADGVDPFERVTFTDPTASFRFDLAGVTLQSSGPLSFETQIFSGTIGADDDLRVVLGNGGTFGAFDLGPNDAANATARTGPDEAAVAAMLNFDLRLSPDDFSSVGTVSLTVDTAAGTGNFGGASNVAFTPVVPEPASLALAAVGGVCLLRRRR